MRIAMSQPLSIDEEKRLRSILKLPDANGLVSINQGGFVQMNLMAQGSANDIAFANDAVPRLMATISYLRELLNNKKLQMDEKVATELERDFKQILENSWFKIDDKNGLDVCNFCRKRMPFDIEMFNDEHSGDCWINKYAYLFPPVV